MIPVPKGYRFAAAMAGFKKADRLDLGLIASDAPAVAAGLFTTNLFQAAPVLVCKETLGRAPRARAILANSGQANACTGEEGYLNCRLTRELVAGACGLNEDDILPASTGVIGAQLKMDAWRAAVPALAESLGRATPMDFTKAVMTTDSFPKLAWGTVETPAGEVRLLGMCKGAGMICPNMATMLAFVLCDGAVAPDLWQRAVTEAVNASFNRVTVDGDTSTNDCLLALANGASNVTLDAAAESALTAALSELCQSLAYMVVEDAEGGTKVLRIRVTGAISDAEAELAARAVGHSPLVKTAMYGKDANWGRIVAALGRSGARFDPDQVNVTLGSIPIFTAGRPAPGDLDGLLAPHMRRQDIAIDVTLGDGPGRYELLASDLTHEYVSINADYRT